MTNSEAPSEVDAATYETKSVQAIRGTEKHSIAKWEKDGWELVTQTPGKLRTGLVFRRPKPKTPWKLFAMLGGVLVMLGVFIGIMAAITGENEDKNPAPISSPRSEPSPAHSEESSVAPEEPVPSVAPAPDVSAAVPITVDALLDKLNSADMGGVQTGDLFKVTGELFMPDLWMTGATGDYFVMLKAQNGAQDLPVFADESEAAAWTDGTKVEMVLRAEEATIDGETSGGWLRAVSTVVLP